MMLLYNWWLWVMKMGLIEIEKVIIVEGKLDKKCI